MWVDQLPEDFSFKLWNDDLERLEAYIEAALARVPPLASVGVRRVVNGPIPCHEKVPRSAPVET
jgi:dimethylglycine dehydrogenase